MTTATTVDSTRAAELFHALSDPIRIDVVAMLTGGERCVCDLMEDLGLQQSRLSWHLKALVDAGIITGRREGRWNYYSLNRDALGEAKDLLDALAPAKSRSLTTLGTTGRRLAVKSNCC